MKRLTYISILVSFVGLINSAFAQILQQEGKFAAILFENPNFPRNILHDIKDFIFVIRLENIYTYAILLIINIAILFTLNKSKR